MSLSLQSHMVQYIVPSIHAAVTDNEGNVDTGTLHQWFADVQWDGDGDEHYDALLHEATELSTDALVQKIADAAIEEAGTTNDAAQFYIDGWTTIEFCDEDTMLRYYA